MKSTLLAAVLLASVTAPALASDVYGVEWVQIPEINCLVGAAASDRSHRVMPTRFPEVPDPIAKCRVAEDNIPAAMDFLVGVYTRVGNAPTWVEEYCKAEPAIPRNKWVCTYEGVTREYR